MERLDKHTGDLISDQQLTWLCDNWSTVLFLNSNEQGDSYLALASSKADQFAGSDISELSRWLAERENSWSFGYLGYDLKNQLEDLDSNNADRLQMPDALFFIPEILIRFSQLGQMEVVYGEFSGFGQMKGNFKNEFRPIRWKETKDEYIKNVVKLKEHIQQGDIYEVNYCHEFYSEDIDVDPCQLYTCVNEITKAPFSVFLKHEEFYILCSSPERFVKKEGSRIISQPMKGTVKRGDNQIDDLKLKNYLEDNQKERSENVMIVDLVRNDLSKVAKRNTVQVDELCRVYPFKTVYQMISTVSAELDDGQSNINAILACFPMGSMTGAPKVRSMELIEKYESTKRGVYSGSIGYINDRGDFDFNVVIRSLHYNSSNRYLSAMVGGAITSKSDPEMEYEETRIKANALILAIEKCTK